MDLLVTNYPNLHVVKSWTTEAGLDACILFVNDMHHCGYVAVPEHLRGTDLEMADISVHGGITYQASPDWANGREVVGYDCAHAGDAMRCPSKYVGTPMEALYQPCEGDVWRDEEYCTQQCESLASQLMNLKTNTLSE